MQDADERAHFSIAGRERMLTNHDWQASMRRLDSIIERLMARRQTN